jgi:hypothetical protein
MKKLSLLDWLTILALLLALGVFFAVPAHGQTIEFPQTVKIGKVALTLPGDATSRQDNVNSPLKRTQTTYYVSKSLDANITVSCIEYRDGVEPRLTAFLEQFLASYGSVDHLATIREDGRKGMSISAEIYHDRSQTRFTYVESRVFADETHLYAVTIETEVTSTKPLRTDSVTEVMASMKVSQ